MGIQQLLPSTQSLLVFTARSYGDLSSWHWNSGLGTWCGAGTPHSQNIPPEFLFTTCVCGTSPFCICAPPTSLDGCGFFNSVVTRLPFSLISDGSKWWLFYTLVVILIWLCEEASRVCLCHHLDWKSEDRSFFFNLLLFPLLNCYVCKGDVILHLFGSGYKKLHYHWGILILNTCIHAAYVLWNLSLSPWTHNVINEYINRFVSTKPFLYSRKTLLVTVLYFRFLIFYLECFYIYLSYLRVDLVPEPHRMDLVKFTYALSCGMD